MIKPSDARKLAESSHLGDELERKIDAAIVRDAAEEHWPCSVALDRYERVAERVANKYRAAGWQVEICHDQRDGTGTMLLRLPVTR